MCPIDSIYPHGLSLHREHLIRSMKREMDRQFWDSLGEADAFKGQNLAGCIVQQYTLPRQRLEQHTVFCTKQHWHLFSLMAEAPHPSRVHACGQRPMETTGSQCQYSKCEEKVIQVLCSLLYPSGVKALKPNGTLFGSNEKTAPPPSQRVKWQQSAIQPRTRKFIDD